MTTSAPADLGRRARRPSARDGAVVDDDPQLGREAGGLGRPVADDRGRGDDQRRAARPRCGRGGRARWASCRGPCRGRGSRRARRRRGSRASRAPRPGSVRSSPTKPSGSRDGVGRRPPWPCASRSAAQPLPSTVMPPPSGVPSRPTAWRRISAPVSWVGAGPLGERGGGLLEVDPVELDPLAVRPHQRAGLGGQAGDVGGGELDVVEHRRPAHVAELVGADDACRRWARRTGAAPGVGLRRDSAGTRTSKPAASSGGPVTVISSQASSWLRYTWPRRRPPARPQHAAEPLEAGELVGERACVRLAVGEGQLDRAGGRPRRRGRAPSRNQASPRVGRVELDDERRSWPRR